MRREYWIGGIFFLVFLAFMIGITISGGKTIQAPSSRTVNSPPPAEVAPTPTAVSLAFDEPIESVTEPVSMQSITLSVEPSPTISAGSGVFQIDGYCKGEDGTVLNNIEIKVYIVNKEEKNFWFMSEWNEETEKTATDENGYYKVSLKGPNQYEIRAIPTSNYLALREEFTLTPSQRTLTKNFTHPLAPFKARGKVIDKTTKAPIAGAEVQLMPRGASNHPNQVFETAISASDGSFEIQRLAKGIFCFIANADGYLDFRPYYPTLDSDHPLNNVVIDQSTQEKTYTIEMEPGGSAVFHVVNADKQPVAQAKIVIIQDSVDIKYVHSETTESDGEAKSSELPYTKLIAQVTHKDYGTAYSAIFEPGTKSNPTQVTIALDGSASISGHVTNAKGVPVPGKKIVLEYLSVKQWNQLPEQEIKTDETGYYSYDKLAAGTYRVSFSGANTSTTLHQRREIALKAGDRQIVDFQMGETRELRGKVVTKSESQPVEKASVYAVIYIKGNIEGTEGTETDAQGEFVIPNAPKGDEIQFQLNKQGYSHTIHHREMDGSYYTLTIDKAGQVRGVVLTPDNQPIPGAKVWPMRYFSFSEPDPMTYDTFLTDNNGTFEFTDLYPMDYRFRASAQGYTDSDSAQYSVHQGESIESVIIQMKEGMQVQGVVLDPQGQPLPGAAVTVYSTIPNIDRNRWGSHMEETEFPVAAVSSSDGTFQIDNFPSEGDEIIVRHENFAPARYKVAAIPPETQTEPQIHTIQMSVGGSIVGKVLDKQNQPIKSTQLVIQNFPENLYRFLAFTDENGEYRFDKLPATNFMVLKQADDRDNNDDEYKTVAVENGQEARCDFGGGEGAVVHGMVFKGKDPYPNVAVALEGSSADMDTDGIGHYFLTTTDSQGNYSFQGIPEGSYQMIASTRVYGHVDQSNCDYSGNIQITKDRTEYLQDIFLGIFTITGTVLDADTKQPLGNVTINPSSHGVNQLNAKTGDDGVFTVMPQDPGTYTFSAIKDGYETKEFQVTIEPDGTKTTYEVTVEMNLIQDDMILIAHLIFDGEPASSSWAHFRSDPQSFTDMLVNSSLPEPGGYRVTGMPEGEINISVYAYCNGKGRSSLPYRVIMRKNQVTEITMNIFETKYYLVFLKTPENTPIGDSPITVEINFPNQPYRQDFHIPKNFQQTEGNLLPLELPVGKQLIRVSTPGYQPMEFIAEEVALPGPNEGQQRIVLNFFRQ